MVNEVITLPPEGIKTIEDILAMAEAEKSELLQLWKEKKARAAKPSHGSKRQPSGKFESA